MDDHQPDTTISGSARRRGCLLGLAVGDAFGAPVEFWRRDEIVERFPPDGITTLEPWHGLPAGTFTDDTQMSIATALGVLDWRAAGGRPDAASAADVAALTDAIWDRYLEWYQSHDWEGRAPGDTCMSALAGGRPGRTDDPARNGSKGCGGVMRVAPLGLIGLGDRAFDAAARAAALTHGHVTSDLSSGFLALLVDRLVAGLGLAEAAGVARERLVAQPGCEETLAAVDAAVASARSDEGPYAAIGRIGSHGVERPDGRGKGWVAEEALGIGLFCALRFGHDYPAAVRAAATITGDSDSTASIAGAILGARFGLEVVPADWAAQAERRDELLALADELGSGD